ncbi:PAS domain-containing protein [Pelagibius sp. CAU 1746]|uniref:PAS domain-containing protein n=1 Tax=Pelagibius sp. CAU 1746 TaxID=3140370 RepID=UPI00325C07DF
MYDPTGNSPTSAEPSFGHIAIDGIEPEAFRQILHAWRAQRGGAAFPPVGKIDPFLVPVLVPNLILYEVTGGAIVFRVVGENVVTATGGSLKGRTLVEAFGDTPYVHMVEGQLRECANSGVPLYSRHDFQLRDETFAEAFHSRKAWRIALPYGEGGRVTRLLCYQLFSKEIETHFRKDIDFGALLPKTVFKIDV